LIIVYFALDIPVKELNLRFILEKSIFKLIFRIGDDPKMTSLPEKNTGKLLEIAVSIS